MPSPPAPRWMAASAAGGLLATGLFLVWSEWVDDLVEVDGQYPHLVNGLLVLLGGLATVTVVGAAWSARSRAFRWSVTALLLSVANLLLLAFSAFGWALVGG